MTYALKPLKWYKNLATKKGRAESGAFIVEGDRAVSQIVSVNPDAILEIVAVAPPPKDYDRFNIRIIEENQFKSISTASTPQGILAVVKSPEDIYSDILPGATGNRILLLEDIQDPGNAGTLIRTAAALGYSGIIMTENCADPLSPKCVQSTAGSVLSVWIRRTKSYQNMIDTLQKGGFTLAAAVLGGIEKPDILLRQNNLILALGNEASGLSQETIKKADIQIRIPIDSGKAESLNVAASGAILMYMSTQ